jgi:hypothetical protein
MSGRSEKEWASAAGLNSMEKERANASKAGRSLKKTSKNLKSEI